jgi:hypothetical protein
MQSTILLCLLGSAAALGVLEEKSHVADAALCDPVQQYTGYYKLDDTVAFTKNVRNFTAALYRTSIRKRN